MSYSTQEIENIRRLAASKDNKNVLLAFEICKTRGVNAELITALYWMYNFFAWNEELKLRFECYDLIEDYWRPSHQIKTIAGLFQTPFVQQTTLRFHHLVLLQNRKWQLDWQWLSDTIISHFKIQQLDFFARKFLLKNCSKTAKETILVQLIQKNHLGQFCLDLGGLELDAVPDFLPTFESIQILKLWGNQLETLADDWAQYSQLEELNLAENNLSSLPPSISQLGQLKKLYINNNNWSLDQDLIQVLIQLPQLDYLSLCNHQEKEINPQFIQLETLINQGKLNAENSQRNILLDLVFGNQEKRNQIHWTQLVLLRLDNNTFVRELALQQLKKSASSLHQMTTPFSICILGEISFRTRTFIEELEQQNIPITSQVTAETSHILLGNAPDISEVDLDEEYVLLLEEELFSN